MSIVQWLLLPLFFHVALILYVGTRTVKGRIKTVMSGKTKLSEIALDSGKWPADVRKLGNNFDNQFDVPMLWYAACGLLVATGKADAVSAILSWAFVVTRFIHSYIHTGSNFVRYRMFAFLSGFALILAMWGWFGLRLFVIG